MESTAVKVKVYQEFYHECPKDGKFGNVMALSRTRRIYKGIGKLLASLKFRSFEAEFPLNMQTLKAIFFLGFLTMATSWSSRSKITNELAANEKFLNNMLTVGRGLQEAGLLTMKATIDAVSAIVTAKLDVLKTMKGNDRITNAIIDIELAQLEASRAAVLAFLKTMATRIVSMVDELPSEDLNALIQSPLFDLASNVFLLLANDSENYSTTEEHLAQTMDD